MHALGRNIAAPVVCITEDRNTSMVSRPMRSNQYGRKVLPCRTQWRERPLGAIGMECSAVKVQDCWLADQNSWPELPPTFF